MTEQAAANPQIAFNPYDGTLSIVLSDGKRYRYQTPWGGSSGHVPPFIYRWQTAVKAHPSNIYRVVLKAINKLIANPQSNWTILEKPQEPSPTPPASNSAPQLRQGRLF